MQQILNNLYNYIIPLIKLKALKWHYYILNRNESLIIASLNYFNYLLLGYV